MADSDFKLEFATNLAGLYKLDEYLMAKTSLNDQDRPVTSPTHTSSLRTAGPAAVFPSSDDNETLAGFQVALEFLDESEFLAENSPTSASPIHNYDVSSTSASDFVDTSTSDPIDTAKPQAKNKKRVSAKQQIDKLRGTAEELSSKLQLLESQRDNSNAVRKPNEIMKTSAQCWPCKFKRPRI
ncbi:hypothetical protein GN958_ATG15295 [Phytophthora infestans]|uniref:Uncharacterized protein n=1 Tax=Phytophthora infestans TaxID=4787 RepID=A0A8S9U9D0_PHYIN|nr:hypothetical protein GN958_ATG15295 [Phytophthora infestans]